MDILCRLRWLVGGGDGKWYCNTYRLGVSNFGALGRLKAEMQRM